MALNKNGHGSTNMPKNENQGHLHDLVDQFLPPICPQPLSPSSSDHHSDDDRQFRTCGGGEVHAHLYLIYIIDSQTTGGYVN